MVSVVVVVANVVGVVVAVVVGIRGQFEEENGVEPAQLWSVCVEVNVNILLPLYLSGYAHLALKIVCVGSNWLFAMLCSTNVRRLYEFWHEQTNGFLSNCTLYKICM